MSVKVFQFNGCNKCFYETLLLKKENQLAIELVSDPKSWNGEHTDIAIITGYLLPSDKETIEKIQTNSDKVIGYGNCTTTGGPFGLAIQKGHIINPLKVFLIDITEINGCLADIDELNDAINGKSPKALESLCNVCPRKSTCEYLDEVSRQIELDNKETCFNDLGFLCNGYIASKCKEMCVSYGTPCRGCKPIIDQSGIRMLGMFGTLMGNVEVATEASEHGATDKLADEDDDMTGSLPDIIGNFFRFTLPISGLPKGRLSSNGSILEDVLTNRLIEELPLITGLLGGTNWITLTFKLIEAYEKGIQMDVNEEVKQYREELLKLEKQLKDSIESEDHAKYAEICEEIRKIAGNMNLSNVFFGGFKTPIDGKNDFENYKTHVFEVVEGTYKNGSIEYTLDSVGKIVNIKLKE